MNIWLRGLDRYSIAQVNYIPTAVSGVGKCYFQGAYTAFFPRNKESLY